MSGREWRGPGEAQRLTDEGQLGARLARQEYETICRQRDAARRGQPLSQEDAEGLKAQIANLEATVEKARAEGWAGWTSRRGLPGASPEGARQLEEHYGAQISALRARLDAGVYP